MQSINSLVGLDTWSTVQDWKFPQQFSWTLRYSGIWHCVAGLVFSDITKEHNIVPSSSRVGPINFWRCRHCILSKEQETPATQCDVSKDLNPQYNLISGVCPSYIIKKKQYFRNQICFHSQMKRWVGTYSLGYCQGELMSVIWLSNWDQVHPF